MGLASSIESVLGSTPLRGKETYTASSDKDALNLIRDASRRGQLASATVNNQYKGLADSVGEAIASAGAPEKAKRQAPPAEREGERTTLYKPENLAPIVGAAETAANVLTGVGTSIVGGWRGLATLAFGGSLDDAVKAVHGTDENAIARTYEPQTKAGQVGTEIMQSDYNPLNWYGLFANKAGEVTSDVATKLGASPNVAAGAGTAVNVGINAAPLIYGAVKAKGAKPANDSSLPASEQAALPEKAGGEQMPLQSVPQGSAAAVEGKPRLKGPPAVAVEGKPPEFVQEAPTAAAGEKLPPTEQARRVAVLKRVGIENARRSAVEGDPLAASTDAQTAKVDSAAGRFMKSTLEAEKEALTKHTEKIVEGTGGTVGVGEDVRMARGANIVAPLDSLKKWFDTKISGLYKEADAKAGGVPVNLEEVHNFINDHRANFLGTTEGKALLEGVTERMKSLGMLDRDGRVPVPVTVAQAEKLNQYLGEVWTPRTGKLIGQLKDSILEGVTRNAGEDIYKQARALRAMRSATLDNPNGISKIMDASGPEGINRSVPIEKIPDAVAGMPVAQLKHVIKTLENVPPEIRPEAQAAIAEIRAHMATKVLETGTAHAGQWNARGVSKLLKNNSAKLGIVFTPEQIASFGDLNEAGHILAKDQSYPGAAVQEHNLVQKGTMAGIRSGSAALGGFVGGPLGAAVGERVGSAAATKLGDAATLRAAQKRVVKLSDFPK